jgi:hypothetical protein
MRARRCFALLGIFLPVIFLIDNLSADESPHHAFATQMGSGIYSARQQTTQIYRVNAAIGILSPLRHQWGINLRLPLAVGFFDYNPYTLLKQELPQSVSTSALLPTCELSHYIHSHWLVIPFAGVGFGIQWSDKTHNWISNIGLRNLFIIPWGKWDLRLSNRFLHAVLFSRNWIKSDDFGLVESGIDLRRPLGIRLAGIGLDGSLVIINYIFKTSPNLFFSSSKPQQEFIEWEFGMTVGAAQHTTIWGIRLPRLGIGYRFGRNGDSIRLTLGNAFPIDQPVD